MRISAGGDPDIKSLIREAPVIPMSADARDVLTILKGSPYTWALSTTSTEASKSVVTTADILESIVGSFHTEEGPAEQAAVRRQDGSYSVVGMDAGR